MSWLVQWSEPGLHTLRRIHWRDAARVDAAVMRFAETGTGDVFRLSWDDHVTLRLRVRPYGVRLTYDRSGGVLTVWSVYELPVL
ncbi:MAG: hypothetical protein QM820_25415 [Minicystis sp.]